MSKRNEAIGTVECPHKGCSQRCEIFRFKERGESPTSVANRRFAGKLYGRCPKHGRFGGDANDTDTQEYILCNASMHGAGDRQSAPAPAAATSPASLSNTKQTTPASPPATKSSPTHSAKRSSERSPPASSSAAKPSASSAPAPAKKKPGGFGFFGWEDS